MSQDTIRTKRIKRGTHRVSTHSGQAVDSGVGRTFNQRPGYLRGRFPELKNANIDKNQRDMSRRISMARRQAINKGTLVAQRICMKCHKPIQYCRCQWP